MTDPRPSPPGTEQRDPAIAAPAPVAPPLPGAPVVKQTERPHPLTPLVRGWLVLVAVLIGGSQQLIPNGQEDGFNLTDLRLILPLIGLVVVLAAVAGFVSWYFTRFVIDDEELRIETGALFKNSKKIPFERLQSVDIIQPLAARVFGLAELRLEAGAGDSTTKLRYLSRNKASRLRDYLLVRAHGQQSRLADHALHPAASALTDLGSQDRPLVRVTPQRLVVGFLLSSEWLISMAVTVVAVTMTVAFGVALFALGGLIPLAIGAVSLIGRRVVAMFNFTLAESPRGLRVTRGLTNLTSQSVPIDRIQGVKTTQPLLWKALGWYRVDVDIVGYGRSDGENNESSATSVLLPVATREEVDLAISRVMPGFDPDSIELHPSPRRARWVRWLDFWTLRYGWDARALITEHGWLSHVRDIVPHAKTQSVRIEQGPLQRLLRLADVHVDTPKGPVNVVAQQLDEADARRLALSQLDRAAAARAAERGDPQQPLAPDDAAAGAAAAGTAAAGPAMWAAQDQVLASFGTSRDQFVGSGGETEVFALGEGHVLRLYRPAHEAPLRVTTQLRQLYDGWRNVDIGIEVPLIVEAGKRGDRYFTVDRRFSGRDFAGWLRNADPAQRRAALVSFLDATLQLQLLPSPVPGFARLIGEDAPRQFGSLSELLHAMLARPTTSSRACLQRDVPAVADVWERLRADLARRTVTPALVHGDVCPPNAYVSSGPSGPVVTGIGDFSPHTINGDPLMDVAGAVIFLELEPYAGAAADSAWLGGVAADRLGAETLPWIGVYRRFYAFYFSNSCDFDPALYAWCLRQLRA